MGGRVELSTPVTNAALIGLGWFLGALARYGMGGWVHRRLPLTTFPWGTLAVNLAGCLAIGALAGLMESRQVFGPQARLFAMIGLLGGFTTFSTFGWETLAMLHDGEILRATANVGVQVIGGLLLVWLGYALLVD